MATCPLKTLVDGEKSIFGIVNKVFKYLCKYSSKNYC